MGSSDIGISSIHSNAHDTLPGKFLVEPTQFDLTFDSEREVNSWYKVLTNRSRYGTVSSSTSYDTMSFEYSSSNAGYLTTSGIGTPSYSGGNVPSHRQRASSM